jgi:hypothetical protein
VKEASRRFNHAARRLLQEEFRGRWLKVVERRERTGVLHFHLLVAVEWDCRTGWDWSAYDAARKARGARRIVQAKSETRKYAAAASPQLRALWARLRERLPRMAFGRHEATPVRDGVRCGKYLAAYLSKGQSLGKGFRAWSVSKDHPRCTSSSFGWCGEYAAKRRAVMGAFHDEMKRFHPSDPPSVVHSVMSAYSRTLWSRSELDTEWARLSGASVEWRKTSSPCFDPLWDGPAPVVLSARYRALPRLKVVNCQNGVFVNVLTRGPELSPAEGGGWNWWYVPFGRWWGKKPASDSASPSGSGPAGPL